MSNESFSNHKSRVESASSSMKQAQVERWSRELDNCLSGLNDPKAWDIVSDQIMEKVPNLNHPQGADIDATIGIFKSYQFSSDKDSVLQGATKKLPQIARAYRLLKSYSEDYGTKQELSLYIGALQRLENAVGEYATEDEIQNTHEAMGLMSDEEVQKTKEQISNLTRRDS